MTKVFIDGKSGTTGLRLAERLAERADIELLTVPEEKRRDPAERSLRMNEADIVFLCLPDEAAREAVGLIRNEHTVIIDTSTAHRVAPGWCYGMPEKTGRREEIRKAKRIANPGCHASGFIALTAPLTERGLIRPDARLSCFSLTGYSGGGKKMIAEYEAEGRDPLLDAPRQYGLTQGHKHLPEMKAESGMRYAPVFCPIVAGYYAGMEVTVPLTPADSGATPEEIRACYRAYYRGGLIRYTEGTDENGFLSAGSMAGRDSMEISVYGQEDRMLLVARFDNLGKGASGAAIQNMNIVIGAEETEGLIP